MNDSDDENDDSADESDVDRKNAQFNVSNLDPIEQEKQQQRRGKRLAAFRNALIGPAIELTRTLLNGVGKFHLVSKCIYFIDLFNFVVDSIDGSAKSVARKHGLRYLLFLLSLAFPDDLESESTSSILNSLDKLCHFTFMSALRFYEAPQSVQNPDDIDALLKPDVFVRPYLISCFILYSCLIIILL